MPGTARRKRYTGDRGMLEQSIFYVFATLLVLSACMVIWVRNPVHAALFLILSFFCSAAIWLILQAEFLAIALVLIYVGAVMVLFLFVVMMLDINISALREGFSRFLPVGILVALLMLVAMGLVTSRILPGAFTGQYTAGIDNTRLLGNALFTEYIYPFEVAGAILLVAIVAAISLTMRKPRVQRTPKPGKQVSVKPASRVRLVNMDSATEGTEAKEGTEGAE